MSKGEKVRVIHTVEMCCGVLMQGNVQYVKQVIQMKGSNIIILDDDSLHWENCLEVIND